MEPQIIFILAIAAAIAAFFLGRRSRNSEIEAVRTSESGRAKQYSEARDKIRQCEARIQELAAQSVLDRRQYKDLRDYADEVLLDWKKQSALLPVLREWWERVQSEYDKALSGSLSARGAWKAGDEVKRAKSEAKLLRKEIELLKPKLSHYEALAPWLAEFSDLTVEEILEGIEEEAKTREFYKSGRDPVSLFVPQEEWSRLTESERNQLALDRYWNGSRKRTAWTAGIQYERYIGYLYEADGYEVTYHGAQFGVDDLGIDLICRSKCVTRIVQCKRLSPAKRLPVRENVIAQVFGAAHFYAMESKENSTFHIDLCTTYECSETARKFAKHLNVNIFERVEFKAYPCIKCNISQLTGERIYHLPFDQQYDATVIGDVAGEFYALTVAEAESAGFRRAFRWKGGG